MARMINIMQVLVFLFLTSSCIKDELSECPSQYAVQVYVGDKNYFNIDDVPQLNRIDENRPFQEYVGQLYYILRNQETGEITNESTFFQVAGNEMYYPITFDNIPNGKYKLTVWGNVTSEVPVGTLHQNESEYTDVYIADTTINISSNYQPTKLVLKRAKGELLLICNNFPDNITTIDQRISSVFQSIDSRFNYSGNTSVVKKSSLQMLNQTFVSPTVVGEKSKLNLRFSGATKAAIPDTLVVPEIEIALKINEISVVSVDYKAETNVWEIWTFIDDEWIMIHRLDIEEHSL